MKKLNMTKTMALLAALCVGTSCFVGSTLAKYTTSGDAAAQARVAKFGVNVATINSADNETFKTTYATTDTTATTITNSVVSTAKVVAPGTSGTFASSSVTGEPEVAVRVSYGATVTLSNNWTKSDGSSFYCPIIIKRGSTVLVNGVTGNYADAAAFQTALTNALANETVDYPAGTNLSTGRGAEDAITWEWPFESGTDNANDVNDTYLGNLATAPEITIALTTTVTQID